jgi:hypothetical protein
MKSLFGGDRHTGRTELRGTTTARELMLIEEYRAAKREVVALGGLSCVLLSILFFFWTYFHGKFLVFYLLGTIGSMTGTYFRWRYEHELKDKLI